MARQWLIPGVGFIDEDGEEEYLIPGYTFMQEDQPVAAPTGDVPGQLTLVGVGQ